MNGVRCEYSWVLVLAAAMEMKEVYRTIDAWTPASSATGVCLRVCVQPVDDATIIDEFARSPTSTRHLTFIRSRLPTDPDPWTSASGRRAEVHRPIARGELRGSIRRRVWRFGATRRARERRGVLARGCRSLSDTPHPRARRSLRSPNAPFAPRLRPCAPPARSTSSSPARARPSPAPSPSRTCSRRRWTPASSSPTWGRRSLSRSAWTSPPSSRPSGCPACPASSNASTPRSSPSRTRA